MKRNATLVLPRARLRLAAFVLTLAAAPACNAYIDPNTGGFIYQLLFPLIVAVAAGWRWLRLFAGSAWQRLKTAVTGRAAPKVDSTNDTAPPDQP
jgi:hypothetical protein